MLQQLLGNLHHRFDKDPALALALRIRHPSGFAWRINNRVLTATTEAGGAIATITLTGRAIDEVATLLEQAGCTVEYMAQELRHRSADILMDGTGRQTQSNGDHMTGYTSLLWAILDSAAIELEAAEQMGVITALRQAYMHTAGGEWLEGWAGFFAVPRPDGMGDVAYLARIIKETLRPRVNGIAIEDTIKDYTGESIDLDEPWRFVHHLSMSPMSGDHHLHDGHHWTWNVIRPTSRQSNAPGDWQDILDLIYRNKPIGTIVDDPQWLPPAMSTLYDYGSAEVGGGALSIFGALVNIMRDMVLDDNLDLSNTGIPTLNYGAAIYAFASLESLDGLGETEDGYITEVPYGAICLSDGLVLGDANAVFGSVVETWEELGGRVLSDNYALSDIEVVHTVTRRDRWWTDFDHVHEANIPSGLLCDSGGGPVFATWIGDSRIGALNEARLSDGFPMIQNLPAVGCASYGALVHMEGSGDGFRLNHWLSSAGDIVTLSSCVSPAIFPEIGDGMQITTEPLIADIYPFRAWTGTWTGYWSTVVAGAAMKTW